jgi:hypothetical protein
MAGAAWFAEGFDSGQAFRWLSLAKNILHENILF